MPAALDGATVSCAPPPPPVARRTAARLLPDVEPGGSPHRAARGGRPAGGRRPPAYATGKLTHGYIGLVCARLEIGVPIFFVLSGFLLLGPWAKAAATGSAPPRLDRYAWRRVRRIMPAYVVAVLLAFVVYQCFTSRPHPGQTWFGLFRYLTPTQIYTDHYLTKFVHQGLSQMWSLAVEAAFYTALPLLAYLLLVVVCDRRWRLSHRRRGACLHPIPSLIVIADN